MIFNAEAPLAAEALAAGKTLLADLPEISAGGITRCYLHWTAQDYCTPYPDYNVCVVLAGSAWQLEITHDPRDQVKGPPYEASHTWHRNTNAVGISITGMVNATYQDFGTEPIQVHEVDYLCAGAAALCKKYDLDPLGQVSYEQRTQHVDNNGDTVDTEAEPYVITHAEAAMYDSYDDERWDLGVFEPLPAGQVPTDEQRMANGDLLRSRIHGYYTAL